jgi:Family of unknown function (DUF5631)/Family of unknown function (DUF5632)
MAIFGRNSARQKLRRAARESLKVPTFNAPIDCTPWVTGGIWPVELSTITADTAPLIKHLKADLQRIISSTNEQLAQVSRAVLPASTRAAEEARIVNSARGFALQRVESTVRHLRQPKPKLPHQYGETDYANTARFKLATRQTTEQSHAGASSQPGSRHDHPSVQPDQPKRSVAPAAEVLPTNEPETVKQENVVREKSEEINLSDSDDTEVLEEVAALLKEIAPVGTTLARPTEGPGLDRAPPLAVPAIEEGETTHPEEPAADFEATPGDLKRILKFVARQEPKLSWAVGVRQDGSTLLVTDVAHGWIPPSLSLPTSVRLLEPGLRAKSVSELLGQTTLSAIYTPGDPLTGGSDYVADFAAANPRKLSAIDDLGWQLTRATHWRDGLPRFVHSLAKAAAAGTGILDSELETLRAYLAASRRQVSTQYPRVDAELLLNCMLLASTEELAARNAANANYHFAWFRTLNFK